jgi:hypothetical protein
VSTSQTGINIYAVLCLHDAYVVGAFAPLDLAKEAVAYIGYPEAMLDGILVSACLQYQIIALSLVTNEDQDQRG